MRTGSAWRGCPESRSKVQPRPRRASQLNISFKSRTGLGPPGLVQGRERRYLPPCLPAHPEWARPRHGTVNLANSQVIVVTGLGIVSVSVGEVLVEGPAGGHKLRRQGIGVLEHFKTPCGQHLPPGLRAGMPPWQQAGSGACARIRQSLAALCWVRGPRSPSCPRWPRAISVPATCFDRGSSARTGPGRPRGARRAWPDAGTKVRRSPPAPAPATLIAPFQGLSPRGTWRLPMTSVDASKVTCTEASVPRSLFR